MGQQEVYEFLAKNPATWFTCRQVAAALDISVGSVTLSLKKLRKTGSVAAREGTVRNTFLYSFTA